jgi:glycine/D-amino acid oxidase-like deaminating enzyme
MKFDIIIVGAGGAGIAVAEMISRDNLKVLLLEKNEYASDEASSAHHGWFHMGSLYAIFPKNNFMRTLIGGTEDLLKYYSNFSNMNIILNSFGKIKTDNTKLGAWFTGKPIDYIVACRNDADFTLKNSKTIYKKLRSILFRASWHLMIRKFIGRHAVFTNHDWNKKKLGSKSIPKAGIWHHRRSMISECEIDGLNLSKNTHIKIFGFDQTMNAPSISKDLLNSFIDNGGDYSTSTEVTEIKRKNGVWIVNSANKTFTADKVLLCAGKWLDAIEMDVVEKPKVRKSLSPLLIVYPKLIKNNFVRMTPFVDKTINHLVHGSPGEEYSVIGCGLYADQNSSESELQEMENTLLEKVESIFPNFPQSQFYEIYWGTKTEYISGVNERNYQYSINSLGENIWYLVPGKYSLIFSVAVNTYKKIFKRNPSKKKKVDKKIPDRVLVRQMRHQRMVSKYLSDR